MLTIPERNRDKIAKCPRPGGSSARNGVMLHSAGFHKGNLNYEHRPNIALAPPGADTFSMLLRKLLSLDGHQIIPPRRSTWVLSVSTMSPNTCHPIFNIRGVSDHEGRTKADCYASRTTLCDRRVIVGWRKVFDHRKGLGDHARLPAATA